MNKTYLLWLFLALFLTACGPVVGQGPTEPFDAGAAPGEPVELQPESQMPVPGNTEPVEEMIVIEEPELPGGAEVLVDLAKADLAERLSVPVDDIRLVSYEELVWPDSSLGCPQPGMEYLQVLFDGARIILDYEGTMYNYHSGGERGLFLCEQALPQKDDEAQLDLSDFITPSPPSDQ